MYFIYFFYDLFDILKREGCPTRLSSNFASRMPCGGANSESRHRRYDMFGLKESIARNTVGSAIGNRWHGAGAHCCHDSIVMAGLLAVPPRRKQPSISDRPQLLHISTVLGSRTFHCWEFQGRNSSYFVTVRERLLSKFFCGNNDFLVSFCHFGEIS